MTRTCDDPAAAGALAAKRENLGLPTGDEATVAFVGGREVRTIPKGWQHPRNPQRTNWYQPLRPDQMPDVAGLAPEEREIAAYETTSEGTPLSPRFPNTPEGTLGLVAFCAVHCTTWGDHTAGPEAWAVILFGEDAAVTADGVVIASNS